MQKAAGKTGRHDERRAAAPAQQPQPEAHRDYPDVFHAVIRQQPLDVMLGQGKNHAQHP